MQALLGRFTLDFDYFLPNGYGLLSHDSLLDYIDSLSDYLNSLSDYHDSFSNYIDSFSDNHNSLLDNHDSLSYFIGFYHIIMIL